MLTTLFAAVFALQSAPALAAPEPAPLSQENRALLRCAAAFALVDEGQAKENEAANKWPPLGTRGREFFVRALAQLMDATASDRAGISQLVGAEAQGLRNRDETDKVMPTCLVMLESSGL